MNRQASATLDKARILHTMVRVCDLEASHRFYLQYLGMRELRREEYPDGRFTLSFVGYDDEQASAVIELTWNWDGQDYTHGSGYGHIAIGCQDIYGLCDRLSDLGVAIIRPPGPMKHVSDSGQPEVIAFVADPDGYRIELIERT